MQHISDANGGSLHSTDLSPNTIQAFHSQYDHTFIDYFASWCIHCQRLAPTWEKFAQELSQQNINQLGIGKVDCVSHDQMCKDERIMAFPTLRWYINGKVDSSMPDYRGDRTVDALVEYAKKRIGKSQDGGDDGRGAGCSSWVGSCQGRRIPYFRSLPPVVCQEQFRRGATSVRTCIRRRSKYRRWHCDRDDGGCKWRQSWRKQGWDYGRKASRRTNQTGPDERPPNSTQCPLRCQIDAYGARSEVASLRCRAYLFSNQRTLGSLCQEG